METLITHIQKFTSLSEPDAREITEMFAVRQQAKKAHVLSEGQTCQELYFVSSGCLRLYFLDEKGIEQTIQFALPGWWMTDLDAFQKATKAHYSIQALEPTETLSISRSSYLQLLDDFPIMEHYFRQIYERAYAAALFRMKVLRLPKELFYDMFVEAYPDFIQRIPQKHVASFLGFTPEYLSELRKKKMRLKK